MSDILARRYAVRLNAVRAVEYDPVRRVGRDADLRLGAAIMLAPRIETAEALLAGVGVPAVRLDDGWRKALRLRGEVVLDEALALRVNAHGPLEEAKGGR